MRAPILISLLLALSGCDDDMSPVGADLSMNPADMSATVDLSAGVQRAADVKLNFEPNGLWWDATTQVLYLSTGSGQIVKWTDSGGLSLFATLPFGFAPNIGDLGQLVTLSDGSVLVTIFGMGTVGGVAKVKSDGSATLIANLSQLRRRIGISVAPDGKIYDSWFVGTKKAIVSAGVSELDLNGGGETDVLVGLKAPIGLVVGATTAYVSDQLQNAIFQMPLTNMDVDGGTSSKLATIQNPDLIGFGPGGDLFVGGDALDRVKPDGTVTQFSTEMRHVRGVAYDADHTRLFVADPDSAYDVDAGSTAVLHIMPVDQ